MSTFEQVQALFLSGGSEEYLGDDIGARWVAKLFPPSVSDAILLRLWDDAAKIRGKQTPPLESYRSDIEKLAATKVGR
jgi:predicted HD phosphohydrolase